MPDRALVTPLAEGSFALALSNQTGANGTGWCSRFLAGPENALLVTAVGDLFTAPADSYNPLILHGPTGVGKSHLAHGIAERFAQVHPSSSVVCETGADFARTYAEAVESRSVPAWREERRFAALYVLDNLDELSDRSAAQIELLHTIDALLQGGNRLLVTARQLPGRIPHLHPGAVSRLSAGLSVALPLPGLAARGIALATMARERQLSIADDALRLLAERVEGTMPELAGSLVELATSVGKARIDREAVQTLLRKRAPARQATIRDIATRTARHYALPLGDLRGPSRRQNVALARSVAMFLARQMTDNTLGAVGKYFGGRDHTTVLHGCRKMEELIARDAEVRQTVSELQSALARN
ncbi:MAG TPA: DnaA/Hda family protein [Pirellulales bacterium]|nr:DnaA/Hda family protein [Pirellulales bacterium]